VILGYLLDTFGLGGISIWPSLTSSSYFFLPPLVGFFVRLGLRLTISDLMEPMLSSSCECTASSRVICWGFLRGLPPLAFYLVPSVPSWMLLSAFLVSSAGTNILKTFLNSSSHRLDANLSSMADYSRASSRGTSFWSEWIYVGLTGGIIAVLSRSMTVSSSLTVDSEYRFLSIEGLDPPSEEFLIPESRCWSEGLQMSVLTTAYYLSGVSKEGPCVRSRESR
jgi:hypothetical protein